MNKLQNVHRDGKPPKPHGKYISQCQSDDPGDKRTIFTLTVPPGGRGWGAETRNFPESHPRGGVRICIHFSLDGHLLAGCQALGSDGRTNKPSSPTQLPNSLPFSQVPISSDGRPWRNSRTALSPSAGTYRGQCREAPKEGEMVGNALRCLVKLAVPPTLPSLPNENLQLPSPYI